LTAEGLWFSFKLKLPQNNSIIKDR